MKVQHTIRLLCIGRSQEQWRSVLLLQILFWMMRFIFSLQPSSIKVQIWHSIWGEAVGAARSQAKPRSNQERLPVVCRAQDLWYHMDETLLLHHQGNTGVSGCEWGEGGREGGREREREREGGRLLYFSNTICMFLLIFVTLCEISYLFQSTTKAKLPISLHLNLCNVKVIQHHIHLV